MKDGNDAFKVLGWGLRKYLWVVLACMFGLGLLLPAYLHHSPKRYDAQAQVGPVQPLALQNLNSLPRLGESVFNNGAVADAIRATFTPPLPRTAAIIPKRVELIAAQDNIVFTVIGHASTPAAAQQFANVAASTFTSELNHYKKAVGQFALTRPAESPARPHPKIGLTLAVGLGLIAGAIAGVGVVALMLAFRRPVATAEQAEEITGVPVFARIRFHSHHGELRGLPQLCHRLLSYPAQMMLLAGAHGTSYERHQIAAEVSKILRKSRRIRIIRGGELDSHNVAMARSKHDDAFEGPDELVVVQGPTQVEVATRPTSSLIVLVVREGISHSSLVRLSEQYLDGGTAGLVMVRSHRWGPRSWRARRQDAKAFAESAAARSSALGKPADSAAK